MDVPLRAFLILHLVLVDREYYGKREKFSVSASPLFRQPYHIPLVQYHDTIVCAALR